MTGELKPHSRDDLITKIAPVDYDPNAKAPRWERFLAEIFAGNREVVDFLWQAIGYSLINGNPAKCLFICWGPKDTGKSTFVNTIRNLFGEYGAPADIQTFMGRVGPMVYNDLADLYGSRLVTASENNESDRLNDGLVKMATGNDPITACRKYENPFKYVPGFKIWLSVNHRPIINDGSSAVWGRLKLLPFEVTFHHAGDEGAPAAGPFMDLELEKTLLTELPGILAWTVRGCHDWIENGFRIPKAVSAAVEEYQRESDQIGEFVDERCITGGEYRVSAGDIYKEYEHWAKSRGFRPMSGAALGRKLSGKNFKISHTRGGNFREGIALKALNV